MNDNEEAVTVLKLDIELNLTGPMQALVNKQAAALLRSVADRLEKDDFQDGFEEINDENGNQIGEIYVDYSDMITY
ncbi:MULTISPECIES: hypothetical protein [Rhizobium]|jgi:hypothetical protein|uniref:Uncharacterized protein n=3 Tax=Rhizobium TaxID=379 RepID=A0A1B1CCF0_RHILE|nr:MULTISPECIES: hypothetical protein [Rhizobium]ANP87437.1 hypothetical protein BA011_18050 [Rhizobium leguminosarum]API54218.1 hypothetical protein BMW22_23715 [Rhizobium leguminosarum]NKM68057.1 hypothetical protein [Rhizobium laguerreae]NNH82659.1 hypothetical protein [Rhizobium laguerreae]TCU25198.1 hypothetical protein EV131_105311 [Rhizobium laguerreae]